MDPYAPETPKCIGQTETDRQTDKKKYRQTDRQTDIQKKTDTSIDRQTDIQTDRQTVESYAPETPNCIGQTETDGQTDR